VEEEKPGWFAVLIGSILALPLFCIVFVIVATIAYVVVRFLNSFDGSFFARVGEFVAAVASAYIGVVVGRMTLDRVLKAWNGWPIFILGILYTALFVVIVVDQPERYNGWWEMVIFGVQNVAMLIAMWPLIVRRDAF
jgi:hypothetical protein